MSKLTALLSRISPKRRGNWFWQVSGRWDSHRTPQDGGRLPDKSCNDNATPIIPWAYPGLDNLADHASFTRRIPDWSGLSYPAAAPPVSTVRLVSCFATKAQLDSPAFRFWSEKMHETWRYHRKLWEFCYIVQALHERDMLRAGRRGLGFAVGEEPLPSLFAQLGCEVTASDLEAEDPRAKPWEATQQLAKGLDALNRREICPADQFQSHVRFQAVDMNRIPAHLRGYDFTWSSCSFEHCGSIELGQKFILEQMHCLKPRGVAVHTTEFNLSSNDDTVSEGTTVIFRRRDIEAIVQNLRALGHSVEPILLDAGHSDEDRHVDKFPYSDNPHLKLMLFDRYISTSIGLIIRKGA